MRAIPGIMKEKRRAALCQRGSIGWGRRNEPSLMPETGFGHNGDTSPTIEFSLTQVHWQRDAEPIKLSKCVVGFQSYHHFPPRVSFFEVSDGL